jgi:hypothetical protein
MEGDGERMEAGVPEASPVTAIAKLRAFTKRAYQEARDGRKVWMEICPCGIALRASSNGRRYNRLISWDRIEDEVLIERMANIEVQALMLGPAANDRGRLIP